MSVSEEEISRWQAAGVIDEATGARIREFERARGAEAQLRASNRPGVLEALLYLGVGIAALGAAVLTGQQWDDLETWARLGALAVPAVLALLAGLAMQATGEPGFVRAAHLAWVASVALVAGTAGVAANSADMDVHAGLLLVGVVTTLMAAALWAYAPSHPQLIALGASLVVFAAGVGAVPDDYSTVAAGMTIMGFGALGLVLVETGLLRPIESGRVVFAAFVVAGPFHAGMGEAIWAELLVFVAGAALIVLSVRRAEFLFMVLGVAAIFVELLTFIFRHLANNIGAPLALMLSGAIIVAGVLILAQLRTRFRDGLAT